jgi:DNA-directed RNA polymerase subunit RPC12/RpoP
MRLKYIQERASVLNTASAKSGVPFVVSAATAELPKVETAAFGCKSCSAEFASTKGSEPFCVNCGSENVSPIQATAQALPETDTGLSAITCKSCGTHNVLSDVTASTLDGHMHCVECGNQLSYDVDELQDPVSDADESAIEQTLNTESATRLARNCGQARIRFRESLRRRLNRRYVL